MADTEQVKSSVPAPLAAEEAKKIGGVERAAILLLALGEKDAAELLRHMGPKEVQDVGLAMASLTDVTTDQMESVMRNNFV